MLKIQTTQVVYKSKEIQMGIQGPYKVQSETLFRFGVGVVPQVSPARDFERSSKEKFVQAVDRDNGLPLWEVDGIDFDPEARERSFKVRIASATEPVVPSSGINTPIVPVSFDGLEISMYPKAMPNGRATIAFNARATGMSAPKPLGAARDNANRENKAA